MPRRKGLKLTIDVGEQRKNECTKINVSNLEPKYTGFNNDARELLDLNGR